MTAEAAPNSWPLASDAPAMTFARYLGLLDAAPSRVSHLLISQLFEHAAAAGIASVASRAVIEIKALEGIGQSRGMKGLQPFTKPPLLGLHKVHYLSHVMPGMPQNLLNEMRRPDQKARLEARIREMLVARHTLSDTSAFDKEMATELSHLIGRELWAERLSRGGGTGDWIVIARYGEVNYYLTRAQHREGGSRKAGDAAIRARIDRACVPQFPFLTSMLCAAS